jgi:hypothetical protein
MSSVFVDCDDTLVLYGGKALCHHFGLLHGESYRPNLELIGRLERFSGHIIVWSGGGMDYATGCTVSTS